jgi:hypothetical protein
LKPGESGVAHIQISDIGVPEIAELRAAFMIKIGQQDDVQAFNLFVNRTQAPYFTQSIVSLDKDGKASLVLAFPGGIKQWTLKGIDFPAGDIEMNLVRQDEREREYLISAKRLADLANIQIVASIKPISTDDTIYSSAVVRLAQNKFFVSPNVMYIVDGKDVSTRRFYASIQSLNGDDFQVQVKSSPFFKTRVEKISKGSYSLIFNNFKSSPDLKIDLEVCQNDAREHLAVPIVLLDGTVK